MTQIVVFSFGDIAFLLLVLLLGTHFWRAQGVRELALRATRLYCQRHELQLLDDSVALRAIWVKRGEDGRLHFWRGYQFEFTTTGEHRYQGRTVTLGRKIESIQAQAHHLPPDRTMH